MASFVLPFFINQIGDSGRIKAQTRKETVLNIVMKNIKGNQFWLISKK